MSTAKAPAAPSGRICEKPNKIDMNSIYQKVNDHCKKTNACFENTNDGLLVL